MRAIRKWLRYYGFEDANPVWVRELAETWADEAERRQAAAVDSARRRAFQQGQVCAFIEQGRSRADAARAAGVTPETVNRWQRADPNFRRAVQNAERHRGPAPTAERQPAKMTVGVQSRIVELLGAGRTRAQAAAEAGVSRQTLYTWLRRRPDFAAAVMAAEDRASLAGS
jgi:DNA-binding XRE family transcriptional regulator